MLLTRSDECFDVQPFLRHESFVYLFFVALYVNRFLVLAENHGHHGQHPNAFSFPPQIVSVRVKHTRRTLPISSLPFPP